MSVLDPELLNVFLPEARGYLSRLPDPDAAHGLKGALAMVGLVVIADHDTLRRARHEFQLFRRSVSRSRR